MTKIIRNNFILIIILILGLFLRFYGLSPGFPDWHPDEPTSYITAIHMLYHNLKPDRIDYPAGVPLLNIIFYIIFFIPLSIINYILSHPNFYLDFMSNQSKALDLYKIHIFGLREVNALYWSRYVAAFIGWLAILMTYVVAKKMFNKTIALFAAFFLSINYLHVFRSHFALPDIYNSFFGILSLYAATLLLEKDSKARYIFSGITVGIFLSIKFLMFALGPYLVAHFLWTYRKKDWKYLFNKNFIYSLLAIAFVFLLLNPYLFSDLSAFIKRSEFTARYYQMGRMTLFSYAYFYLFYWGIGPFPSIAIFFGAIVMAVKNFKNFLLIFSFVVPLFFVMTFYSIGGQYTRNFVPAMPYLMIFAGYSIYILYRFLTGIKFFPRIILFLFILIFLTFSSIKNSFFLSYYYSKEWSVIPLTRWINNNFPSNTTIQSCQLFLLDDGKAVFAKKKIIDKDWFCSSIKKGMNSLAELQAEGMEFAILNTILIENNTYKWMFYPRLFINKNNIPFDYIENGFFGSVIKELLNYTVFETYKPWQANHNPNYVVFKIPQKTRELGKRIVYFGFDDNKEGWKIRSTYGFKLIAIRLDKNAGKTANGALKIERVVSKAVIPEFGGGITARISSPAISITEGKLYTARAFILNEPKGSIEEKDGFLRIDFYKEKGEDRFEKVGDSVALSQRAPATGNWEEVQVSMKAPKGAQYLTISFQRKDLFPFSSYIDDVELFETNLVPQETFKEIPYIKPTMPLDSIYYNSFL